MVIKLSDYILEQDISSSSASDIELEILIAEMDVSFALFEAYIKKYKMSVYQEMDAPPPPKVDIPKPAETAIVSTAPDQTATTQTALQDIVDFGTNVIEKQAEKKSAANPMNTPEAKAAKRALVTALTYFLSMIVNTIFRIYRANDSKKYEAFMQNKQKLESLKGIHKAAGSAKLYATHLPGLLKASIMTAKYYSEMIRPLLAVVTNRPYLFKGDMRVHQFLQQYERTCAEIEKQCQALLNNINTFNSSYNSYIQAAGSGGITAEDVQNILNVIKSQEMTEVIKSLQTMSNSKANFQNIDRNIDENLEYDAIDKLGKMTNKLRQTSTSLLQEALKASEATMSECMKMINEANNIQSIQQQQQQQQQVKG